VVFTDAIDCALLCEFALGGRIGPAAFVHWALLAGPGVLEAMVGTLIEGMKSGGGVAIAFRSTPAGEGSGRAPPGRGTRLVRRSVRYSAVHTLCESGMLLPGGDETEEEEEEERDFRGEDLRGE